MKCPFCFRSTKVYNSRSSHASTQTWRRRKCLSCHRTFTTREKVDLSGVISVKTAGGEQPYSRERLLLSLVRASDKLNFPLAMLTELTDSIELELNKAEFFTSSPQGSELITAITISILERYDKNLSLQYINQVYKNQPPLELLNSIINS